MNIATTRFLAILLILAAVVSGCRKKAESYAEAKEDRQAKALLQGIWVDSDTEEVTFKAKGDTIYYPDSTSQPTPFKIVGDTLIMGAPEAKYAIVKQAAHIFWFKNQNGDVVKLMKSEDPNDALPFVHEKPKIMTYTSVVKRDTVVMYNGERYHCYIAINPTKYKVVRTTYNSDGVGVDNVYYDNIIHISVFHGAEQLYSRDIRKQMYARFVPSQFLQQAILSNMTFEKADAQGFHFFATICMPDGASCYMLDTKVSLQGKLSMELIEY